MRISFDAYCSRIKMLRSCSKVDFHRARILVLLTLAFGSGVPYVLAAEQEAIPETLIEETAPNRFKSTQLHAYGDALHAALGRLADTVQSLEQGLSTRKQLDELNESVTEKLGFLQAHVEELRVLEKEIIAYLESNGNDVVSMGRGASPRRALVPISNGTSQESKGGSGNLVTTFNGKEFLPRFEWVIDEQNGFDYGNEIAKKFEKLFRLINLVEVSDPRDLRSPVLRLQDFISDLTRPDRKFAPETDGNERIKPTLYESPHMDHRGPSENSGPPPVPPNYLSYGNANNKVAGLTVVPVMLTPPLASPRVNECNHAAADLQATTEVQSTHPAIQRIAAQLGYSPAKIYAYVHNNMRLELYAGSLKDSLGVLETDAGNALDQASLLIALLRASNIPARYVKGEVEFSSDPRFHNWLGAKTTLGGLGILKAASIRSWGNASKVVFDHVWVEACVPYLDYRGSARSDHEFRWIPLDPSFTETQFRPGLDVKIPFNRDSFLSRRRVELASEYFASDVETQISSYPPRFANNELADVFTTNTPVGLRFSVLPTTLPYKVRSFQSWADGGPASVSAFPASLKQQYELSLVRRGQSSVLLDKMAVSDVTKKELVLKFSPDVGRGECGFWEYFDYIITRYITTPSQYYAWRAILPPDGSIFWGCSREPRFYVDGVLVHAPALKPYMEVLPPNTSAADRAENERNMANVFTVRARVFAGGRLISENETTVSAHETTVYVVNGRHVDEKRLANEARALINRSVSGYSAGTGAGSASDDLLNLVALRFIKRFTDSATKIAGLRGSVSIPGFTLVTTGLTAEPTWLFDLPFGVRASGFYIDVAAQFDAIDQITGQSDENAFFAVGSAASELEAYVWQETLRMDSLSTVRGLQYAQEVGIPVLRITAANATSQLPLLRSNAPADNYPDDVVAEMESIVATSDSALIIAPIRQFSYENWRGFVWLAETVRGGSLKAYYKISGLDGGVTTTPDSRSTFSSTTPVSAGSNVVSNPIVNSVVNNGTSLGTVFGGDPVNLVTGNLYHTETDISLQGRGGLDFVLTRSYNNRDPSDGPFGHGWTHSFNHYLEFKDAPFDGTSTPNDGVTSSLTWVDASGGRRFIKVASGASGSGVGVGAALTAPDGFYFSARRSVSGFEIQQKNGLIYEFEPVPGTPEQRARLSKIIDRNGNSLTLNYSSGRLQSIVDELGRSMTFEYSDGTNHITATQDWSGQRIEYRYSAGNLIEVWGPLALAGKAAPIRYEYYNEAPLTHMMKRFTATVGNGMSFEYYANGRVFRHYNDVGDTMTFRYNDFRRETVTINERGHQRTVFFNENGNPVKSIEENGAIREYLYEDPQHPMLRTATRDPLGHITRYGYDARGNLVRITKPSLNTVQYSDFNVNFNRPGKVKDPKGNYKIYKYDAAGNRTDILVLKAGIGETLDPVSYVPVPEDLLAWTKISYNAFGSVTEVKRVENFTTLEGPTTAFEYDAQGINVAKRTRIADEDGDGTISDDEHRTAVFSYDSAGRIESGVDSNWYSVSYDYDIAGRVTSATDQNGYDRQAEYDGNGNLRRSFLAVNGVVIDESQYLYDHADRLVSTMDRAGYVDSVTYDPLGNVIRAEDADGRALTFEYDPGNHVVQAMDQAGHSVQREVDVMGRPRSITDTVGNVTTYTYYDATGDGRLRRVTEPGMSWKEFSYDANGNVTSVTDNLGRTVTATYDALNRPRRIEQPEYFDAELGATVRPVTEYEYSSLGDLTWIWAGHSGQATLAPQSFMEYNDFGQVALRMDGLFKQSEFRYDHHGNLIRAKDASGRIEEYTYYYGGSLESRTAYRSETDPSPHTTVYIRNALGQMSQVASPEVTYSYSYDELHRMTEVLDSRGNKRVRYGYSPSGLVDYMLDDEGGRTDYLYDQTGRVTHIWAPNDDFITFVYDSGGRLVERWMPDGGTSRYAYDEDNQVVLVENVRVDGTPISSHEYGYDEGNRRDYVRDEIDGTVFEHRYAYDALDRLAEIQDTDSNPLETYTYDAFSNRRTKTDTGTASTVYYEYDEAHQLQAIHQDAIDGPLLANFSYDDNGNLLSKSGTQSLSMAYDALNRVEEVTASGVTERYTYGPNGRRLSKATGASRTEFIYDGLNILAEYSDGWDGQTARYTHGGLDVPTIREVGAKASYYHADGLGSVVAVQGGGAAIRTAHYDAWGNVDGGTGGIDRYGFTGREPDQTGLIYFRARYYDPQVGRFTQRDPLGFIDGVNQYVYAVNSPLNYVDPMGTQGINPAWMNAINERSGYTGVPSYNVTSPAPTMRSSITSGQSASLVKSVLMGPRTEEKPDERSPVWQKSYDRYVGLFDTNEVPDYAQFLDLKDLPRTTREGDRKFRMNMAYEGLKFSFGLIIRTHYVDTVTIYSVREHRQWTEYWSENGRAIGPRIRKGYVFSRYESKVHSKRIGLEFWLQENAL